MTIYKAAVKWSQRNGALTWSSVAAKMLSSSMSKETRGQSFCDLEGKSCAGHHYALGIDLWMEDTTNLR